MLPFVGVARLSFASFIVVLVGVGACGLDVVGVPSTGGPPADADVSFDAATPGDDASTNPQPPADGAAGVDASSDGEAGPPTPLLALSMTAPPPDLDLEVEGTTAWIHWGRTTNDEDSMNEKASAPGAIPTFSLSGSTDLRTYEDNITTFRWTNGTPVASENGTKNGVYSKTNKPKFTLRRKAGVTSAMRMVVYAGVFKATGRFTVTLGAAPDAPTASMDLDDTNKAYGRFAIDYRTPDAESELVIAWELVKAYDPNNSNVTLAAATLRPGN